VNDLATARCTLRPLTSADRRAVHRLWTSPGVRRFLWDDEIIPLARTEAALEENTRLFDERRYGLWGARARGASADPLVGFAGLWFFREPPELELVYGIADEACGRGYATEIARAVVAYAFEELDMPILRGSTDRANAASVRVLEKIGFAFVDRRTISGLDTVFYALERAAARGERTHASG
jgi:ribosomal-protein-alanine N-acetyltransferase